MKTPSTFLIFLGSLAVCGCQTPTPSHPGIRESITDSAYLTQKNWDDGKAEVAFYEVERYLQVDEKKTVLPSIAASILVKHDYDPIRLIKAVGFSQQKVPSFQWVFFYELDDRYATKYAFSVHAAQSNLQPLKQSFSAMSFEGNGYVELSFLPDTTIRVVNRGDRVSQPDQIVAGRPNAYPIGLVPLLIRALDFSEKKRLDFLAVLLNGKVIPAHATGVEPDTLRLGQSDVACEKVVVTYEGLPRQAVGITAYLASEETYWRSKTPNRQILQLQSSVIETGLLGKKVRISYRMKLIEELRAAYWKEDIRARLRRIKELP
ncbi:MAG: hypothetical protein D6743_15960 [Calditrichaeota bacterium]|nr:MAG: hypothetical protein D6743_15960 [Calditrichota bacterium]